MDCLSAVVSRFPLGTTLFTAGVEASILAGQRHPSDSSCFRLNDSIKGARHANPG